MRRYLGVQGSRCCTAENRDDSVSINIDQSFTAEGKAVASSALHICSRYKTAGGRIAHAEVASKYW